MALTEAQEKNLLAMWDAFAGGQKVTDLPVAEGSIEGMTVEVTDKTGESKRLNLYSAINQVNKKVAMRRWNETLSTPTGEAYGNLDFLRELPNVLGLGCYLVADDRTRRKLDPTNHYKFDDGSPAKLDGSMGQYMWCWNGHYYASWKEGNYFYEAVSLEPIDGQESYYIPEGGTSALGGGVVDRTNLILCSVINNDVQYRGGSNTAAFVDDQYKSLCGRVACSIALSTFSTYARKRGEGWEANWYVSRAVQEYLFRIIMGTRHCQAAYNPSKDSNGLFQGGLGNGVTTLSTAEWNEWSDYSTAGVNYQPPVPTSAGVELGDGVGVVDYNLLNRDGSVFKTVQIPVFFGLKHMWGHIWQGVRGLINDIKDAESFVYVAPSLYAGQSNTSTAEMLKAAQFPAGMGEGYIKKMSNYRLCNAPTEIGGSATTYYGDYFWRNNGSGLRCRLAGGSCHNGANAGAGAYHANYAVTYSGTNVSAPLCYFKQDPIIT